MTRINKTNPRNPRNPRLIPLLVAAPLGYAFARRFPPCPYPLLRLSVLSRLWRKTSQENKNRMSSTNAFAGFATRLRVFIDRDDNEFNKLALELFALQFEYNQPYRRFCEARGVKPQNITRWNEIPAIPTSAFKEWELSCLPVEQRPSRHFHSAESLEIYETSLWPWFAAHLVPDFKSKTPDFRLAILTPPPPQAPHSSLVHMFDSVRRKLAAQEASFLGRAADDGTWRLDFEPALRLLRQATSAELPVLLVGTAFSFVHLLDYLA